MAISKSFHLFVIILLYYGAKVSFFREKNKKKCIFLEHVQYILLSGIYLHLFNCQKLA
ncbi:Uncharacterised protein [Segatella copri]|nr:Uncharacterised protein [Segatella copri]